MSALDTLPGVLPLLLLVAVLGAAAVKIGVVLAVLRQGLGLPGVPPAAVTAVLALLLSAVVMAPVAERSLLAMKGRPEGALAAGAEPLREFLKQHTPQRERAAVLELARRVRAPADRAAVSDADLAVLAPAFVLAELKLAFQLGFLLLLPFLVLDLLVASLIQGFSLPGLDARAVALPFKLLLFVVCDGWHLLARGLILGYT
jgi:type III secretion protein R